MSYETLAVTTLKLPPKATPADSNAPSGRKPVRRADPAKRPRDAASKPAANVPAKEAEARVPANKPARAVSARPAAERAAPKRQRNHRHDGTLHEHQVAESPAENDRPRRVAADRDASERQPARRSASDRPARSGESRPRADNARPENRQRDERPAERSERPRRPAADRADRLASDRDTPRRGGKARDGFVAGDFNRDRTQNPMFTPKPVASQPDLPRLSKRMAELGLCSRREADEWIVNGWVRVNGQVVDELGSRVEPDANIEVSKEAEKHGEEKNDINSQISEPLGSKVSLVVSEDLEEHDEGYVNIYSESKDKPMIIEDYKVENLAQTWIPERAGPGRSPGY